MKFDTLVIGGGLSGLVAAIESVRCGLKTAIVSTGQSALHFWSGSFEFLGNVGGKTIVDSPLDAVSELSADHPYRKIGEKRLQVLLDKVPSLLKDAGIKTSGSLTHNHWRLTPMGFMKPAWLTVDDYACFDDIDHMPWKKVAIVNVAGYLDFYPRFLAHGLEQHGVECEMRVVNIPQLDSLRKSATEMRATNMARVLRNDAAEALAKAINGAIAGTGVDAVIMPAILGMFSDRPVVRLRSNADVPVFFVPTIPASVPGVRCQLSLRDLFTRLGGVFMPGDTVTHGVVEDSSLKRVYTRNMQDMPLEADNFIIATGSFFGHGLIATMDKIRESVFGLDLNITAGRTEWYEKDYYAPQPYMNFGVLTDEYFRPSRDGKTIENLYATGALLAGFNALKEGSGAGITLATALSAADNVINGIDKSSKK